MRCRTAPFRSSTWERCRPGAMCRSCREGSRSARARCTSHPHCESARGDSAPRPARPRGGTAELRPRPPSRPSAWARPGPRRRTLTCRAGASDRHGSVIETWFLQRRIPGHGDGMAMRRYRTGRYGPRRRTGRCFTTTANVRSGVRPSREPRDCSCTTPCRPARASRVCGITASSPAAALSAGVNSTWRSGLDGPVHEVDPDSSR